jgi:uridine phosphorylase
VALLTGDPARVHRIAEMLTIQAKSAMPRVLNRKGRIPGTLVSVVSGHRHHDRHAMYELAQLGVRVVVRPGR